MRSPDPITEVRTYRVIDTYRLTDVYVTQSGDCFRVDTLEPWAPTPHHILDRVSTTSVQGCVVMVDDGAEDYRQAAHGQRLPQ